MLLVVCSTGFVACSSDDDETELTSNCYISAFKLTSLKRIVTTTSTSGTDSTYTTTTSASSVRMRIDHREGTITNIDLLPMGSQLDKVVVAITAEGTVAYAPQNDTTTWTVPSTSDSLDFTSPLIFRVIANNGNGYRDYRVTLQVRENNAYGYTWTRLDDQAAMAGKTDAKLLVWNGSQLLLTEDSLGQCFANENLCKGLPLGAKVRSVVAYNGCLWMNTATGLLFNTNDGINWQQVGNGSTSVRLTAASRNALYAMISEGTAAPAMASTNDGLTWTTSPVENLLFDETKAAVAYTQSNGNQRVLALADVYDDNSSRPMWAWSLLEGSGEAWLPFNDGTTQYPLPRWENPTVVSYNDWLVALGDRDLSTNHTPLDTIFISRDNGINWRYDSYLNTPSALKGAEGPVTAAVIGEYIHIIAGQQKWAVRYNSYGE